MFLDLLRILMDILLKNEAPLVSALA